MLKLLDCWPDLIAIKRMLRSAANRGKAKFIPHFDPASSSEVVV